MGRPIIFFVTFSIAKQFCDIVYIFLFASSKDETLPKGGLPPQIFVSYNIGHSFPIEGNRYKDKGMSGS